MKLTSSSDHGPDPSRRIENGQLQTGAGFRVQISDVGLLGIGVPAERRRIVDLAPVRPADEVRGRVQLGGQIQNVNGIVRHHQRIDFQIREIQIDVEFVQ